MMSTSEDDPSSLNDRLRPRKSTVPDTQRRKKTRRSDRKAPEAKDKNLNSTKKVPEKSEETIEKPRLPPNLKVLCPFCDKTFATKKSLSKHVSRTHFPGTKVEASIQCQFCKQIELDFANVIRHMVDSHPDQYFACLDCHTRFSSTNDLADHKLQACDKQKSNSAKPYRSKLRQKLKSSDNRRHKNIEIQEKDDYSLGEGYSPNQGFNGIVISCEPKPSEMQDTADIEDNITTNLILPRSKNMSNSSSLEKNAVIILDDIQWKKRIPPNFSFRNNDADQILSRLGVVHRSPRTSEHTRRDWYKQIEESTKFERCFDTSFYSKVASNVQENLSKFLEGSFNRLQQNPENIIKTRKAKNSVAINTAEGFPILLACEQYSRNVYDSYLPRGIAPKHKWKWDSVENEKSLLNADQIKRDSHVNNCIITLVSSLDIWTQLCMRRKFEAKYNKSSFNEKKTEKQNIISNELKEILESRELPNTASKAVGFVDKPPMPSERVEFPMSLGLAPRTNSPPVPVPAVLSGEWARPRCYVCCACGEPAREPRALAAHMAARHPYARVSHYDVVGDMLRDADILQHLYVPPPQPTNRTRPLRGIRDCTKCKKSISLEDFHEHMLDCAGDTPVVRRKFRHRPFGVRKKRNRLPEKSTHKTIRKDIRHEQRQKSHLRHRTKIRTEVGDAETIRKMIADLPAKRHRVMINPLNSNLLSRRKEDQTRSSLLIKRCSSFDTKIKKQIRVKECSVMGKPENLRKDLGKAKKDDNLNIAKTRLTHVINKSIRQKDMIKRKTLMRQAKRKARAVIETSNKDIVQEKPTTVSSSAVQTEDISISNSQEKVNINKEVANPQQHSAKDGSNSQDGQKPGCPQQNRNTQNSGVPQNTTPLKHSIARLTANTETHDKSVQFQPHFLVHQECYKNIEKPYVTSGFQTLFENETVAVKLDKPPLPTFNQKCQVDLYANQKNKQNKPRKGLNDCIAMLKNKLIDPISTGHRSVQCDTADIDQYAELPIKNNTSLSTCSESDYSPSMVSTIPPAHASTSAVPMLAAPLDLSGKSSTSHSMDDNDDSYETLDLSNKNLNSSSTAVNLKLNENKDEMSSNASAVDLCIKGSKQINVEQTLDLSAKKNKYINEIPQECSVKSPVVYVEVVAQELSNVKKSPLLQEQSVKSSVPIVEVVSQELTDVKNAQKKCVDKVPQSQCIDKSLQKHVFDPTLKIPQYKIRTTNTKTRLQTMAALPVSVPETSFTNSTSPRLSNDNNTKYIKNTDKPSEPNIPNSDVQPDLCYSYAQSKVTVASTGTATPTPTLHERPCSLNNASSVSVSKKEIINLNMAPSGSLGDNPAKKNPDYNFSKDVPIDNVNHTTVARTDLVVPATTITTTLESSGSETVSVATSSTMENISPPSATEIEIKRQEIVVPLNSLQELETAKKIALLPKEIVEILGKMPTDHRNQLLNVLPQYMAYNSAVKQLKLVVDIHPDALISPLGKATLTSNKSEIATQTSQSSIEQTCPPEFVNIDTENYLIDPVTGAITERVHKDNVDAPQIDGFLNNDIEIVQDSKIDENLALNSLPSNEEDFTPIIVNATKPKEGNEKTASLRAVRIKTAEMRKSQQLKCKIVEQLPPDVNNSVKVYNEDNACQAIQQAEVSSTQQTSRSNMGSHSVVPFVTIENDANATTINKKRRTSTSVLEPKINSVSKNQASKLESSLDITANKELDAGLDVHIKCSQSSASDVKNQNDINTSNTNIQEFVPAVVKKSLKSVLLKDSITEEVLQNISTTNPKDQTQEVRETLTESQEARETLTESQEAMKCIEDDDSEDDVSLAVIVKQKILCQTKQVASKDVLSLSEHPTCQQKGRKKRKTFKCQNENQKQIDSFGVSVEANNGKDQSNLVERETNDIPQSEKSHFNKKCEVDVVEKLSPDPQCTKIIKIKKKCNKMNYNKDFTNKKVQDTSKETHVREEHSEDSYMPNTISVDCVNSENKNVKATSESHTDAEAMDSLEDVPKDTSMVQSNGNCVEISTLNISNEPNYNKSKRCKKANGRKKKNVAAITLEERSDKDDFKEKSLEKCTKPHKDDLSENTYISIAEQTDFPARTSAITDIINVLSESSQKHIDIKEIEYSKDTCLANNGKEEDHRATVANEMCLAQSSQEMFKPLRRSKRGKSTFVEDPTNNSELFKSDPSLEVKAPITKKQLIFSKLLLDEENKTKMSLPTDLTSKDTFTEIKYLDEDKINENPNSSDVIIETLPQQLANDELELKSKHKKSLRLKKISKRRKRHHRQKQKNNNLTSDDLQSIIPKPIEEVSEKEFYKVSSPLVVENDNQRVKGIDLSDKITLLNETINHSMCDHNQEKFLDYKNDQLSLEKKSPKIDKNKIECSLKAAKSEIQKDLMMIKKSLDRHITIPKDLLPVEVFSHQTNTLSDKGSCSKRYRRTTDITEKRKIETQTSSSLYEIDSNPKKSKSKDTDYSSDSSKSLIEEINSTTKSFKDFLERPYATCYDMPKPCQTQSVAGKSFVDTYDPYDIDLEVKLLQKAEKLPKKITHTVTEKSLKEGYTLTSNIQSKQIFNKNSKKSHTIVLADIVSSQSESSEIFCCCAVNGGVIESDSDESTKSDIPLKKYIDESNKKSESESNFPEKDNSSSQKERKSRNKRRCTIKQNSQQEDKNVEKNPQETEENSDELRSEQFMESFGFFSERKPRKSNLLASKKISETFHIIASENDDGYFEPKERATKRVERRKSASPTFSEEECTAKSSEYCLRKGKRGRKRRAPNPASYCEICRREFRRPDNYVRHQMTLLHISRLSLKEMNIDLEPIQEGPNYLVVYNQHLQRLKRLTEKLQKRNKKLGIDPADAPKIELPTLADIIADAKMQTYKLQSFSRRGLSRDEALFLHCCELLKESHKIEGPSSEAAQSTEHSELVVQDRYDSKNDGDVDSLTAKTILESEEVRNLENDLISGLKEAVSKTVNTSTEIHKVQFLGQGNDCQASSSKCSILHFNNPEVECAKVDGNYSNKLHTVTGDEINLKNCSPKRSQSPLSHIEEFDVTEELVQKTKKAKTKLNATLDIDIFEDKFDKIKRKCRSQAAAAKNIQTPVEPVTSHKEKKKSEKRKIKKTSKKSRHNIIPTKGALKGFDGIKVSIPTSEINISALMPCFSDSPPKKKKRNNAKKKRDKKDSESSCKYGSESRASPALPVNQSKIDVYEFMDNDDADMFEFRPSTLKERFKSSFKEGPSTSKADLSFQRTEEQSASGSDGDDFVYMSDDYLCSADETENSLMSCELGSGKISVDTKKSSSLKRKDAIEKNAVMGKIFKHNAVRNEKKQKIKDTAKSPKANLDQLFDSLLEDEPNSSVLKVDNDMTQPNRVSPNRIIEARSFESETHVKYTPKHPESVIRSPKRSDKQSRRISTSKSLNKLGTEKNKRNHSPDRAYSEVHSPIPERKPHFGVMKSPDRVDSDIPGTSNDLFPLLEDFSDETGVARHRVRRKCTVGKQNVLAETWSSESEVEGDGGTGAGVSSGGGARRRGKRVSAGGPTRRPRPLALGRLGEERIEERSGDDDRSRSQLGYYWSSDGEPETNHAAHAQQHGWIVGNSHKKLVTMLAHAKGRKRDDKCHDVE